MNTTQRLQTPPVLPSAHALFYCYMDMNGGSRLFYWSQSWAPLAHKRLADFCQRNCNLSYWFGSTSCTPGVHITIKLVLTATLSKWEMTLASHSRTGTVSFSKAMHGTYVAFDYASPVLLLNWRLVSWAAKLASFTSNEFTTWVEEETGKNCMWFPWSLDCLLHFWLKWQS